MCKLITKKNDTEGVISCTSLVGILSNRGSTGFMTNELALDHNFIIISHALARKKKKTCTNSCHEPCEDNSFAPLCFGKR